MAEHKVSLKGIDWAEARELLDSMIMTRLEAMKRRVEVDTIPDLAALLSGRVSVEMLEQVQKAERQEELPAGKREELPGGNVPRFVPFVCLVCREGTSYKDHLFITKETPEGITTLHYHEKCYLRERHDEAANH